MPSGQLKFSKIAAIVGVTGGVVVAAGVPIAVVIYGAHLGGGAQVAIIILALLIGGLTTAVSAFFGAVIPSFIGGGMDGMIPGMSRLGKIMKLNVEKNKDGTKKVHMEMGGDTEETASSASDNETG